ncbi:MAG: helix-turn-helix domain-containing protein [Treponema sp.]|nr:helix-turn-helix domain-containing protein [Treponema sp.]
MPGKAPALEKGLLVLEFLIAANEPLTLSRIAEGLGYKVSEIQRMVEFLAKEDYLVKTGTGAYQPGARAFRLADLPRESAIISRAEGPLKRFALRTTESIHLGFLSERLLHVVYDSFGYGTVRVSIKPGIYHADDTVSGRLLLAFRGEEGQDFETIRGKGHEFGGVNCAQGALAIAVPVSLGPESVAAAIATVYLLKGGEPESGFRQDLLVELEATSREISALF